jgi:tetratricopeptide (TPR) repeat protein
MKHRPLHQKHFRKLTALSLALTLSAPLVSGCSKSPRSPEAGFAELREDASSSKNPDEVADWLLAETLRPGGTPDQAIKARQQLDAIEAEGVLANLARGIDDFNHGRAIQAAEGFFAALTQARTWDDPRASLLAWFAALRVDELSGLVSDFGPRHRGEIQTLLSEPGNIGFRAYAKVVDLWVQDAFSEAEEDIDRKLAEKLGCVSNISLAGPFGTGTGSDILRHFEAEAPGPWPARFEMEPAQATTPRRLKTEQIGCDVLSADATWSGIFYGQTFIENDQPRELILSAAGATHLFINDSLVLHRDVRSWGIWPKFGVKIQLPAGRHRVLWKFGDASSALRIVNSDGSPANVKTSGDDSLGYDLVPAVVLDDPNDLMRYIHAGGVNDPEDELSRYGAAYLAREEGQTDVAAVLFEPLVSDPEKATGVALSSAAGFVEADPIFDEAQTRDLVHELELRAAEHDRGLWYPAFRNIVWEAKQKGATTIIGDLEKLARRFPEASAIHFTLAELYGNLEWGPERQTKVRDLLKKFPNDEEAIKLGIDLFEEEGNFKQVDELLARLRHLNPDSELFVARALNQQDYESALQELHKLRTRRPSRKDIAPRIEKILIQAGDKQDTFEQLKKAILREPRDVHARLAWADAKLAAGDNNPLPEALIGAVEAGADPSLIEGAIDLMEGLTALEPYRLDGRTIISEYEAHGQHQPGTAARVLDYGALWVRGDGSSRFLEHEIVRIQSEEAVKKFTETQTHGLVLKMRVIKQDGTVMEPEAVAGKPTVTMPHLAVGDYVETERILSQWGDGVGSSYLGPGWFFREQNVAYNRSEFVVIAPRDKDLMVEAHNGAPEPVIETKDSVIVYRYRVDQSPAAPVEPNSPPDQEFLPRVAVGWGLSFKDRINGLSREMISLTASDPRIVRIAQNIAKGKKTETSKARALYHWVLDNVQDGEEADGRRVVVSRNGNRWRGFQTLCQALGVQVRWALAESRLSSPLLGPISKAERPLLPLLVVEDRKEQIFLTIDDKFAPFGTVPSHMRGERAYLLGALNAVETTVPRVGATDGIRYKGTGSLSANGTAELSLKIIFLGSYATSLRNGLSQIPENQLGNIIESRLLGQYLQGSQLKDFKVIDQDNLDKPLVISVVTEVPQFATPSATGLLISPPFMPQLTGLTPLARRATPLLIGQESEQSLDLELTLPQGIQAVVVTDHGQNELSRYEVTDTAQTGSIHFRRSITTKAGRIPVEKYVAFQKYANQADASLARPVALKR